MKVSFIGGGSMKWTARLVVDLISHDTTADAELILHDVDSDALDLVQRACQRINNELGGGLHISTSLDRGQALYDADFVILCVAIGGLEAVRNDLLIPQKYHIYQSVGDSVGPGGLARALRHIPFAVNLAREMEKLCPKAWLLNLTNPMTTICRSVTRITNIKTIGLCHEVDIFRKRWLPILLEDPAEEINFEVSGINHLPVILDLAIGGQSGDSMLADWLTDHSAFEFVDFHVEGHENLFVDRMAIKLSLFKDHGILFGSGDRHIAEFFPNFLSEENQFGKRHGVYLTTADHRQEMALLERRKHEDFLNGNEMDFSSTDEQLVPVMAALSGGPTGTFVVNVPVQDDEGVLPDGAVLECSAFIDRFGVHKSMTAELKDDAQRIIAPHIARQELIVESALSGDEKPALAALADDPLVADPMVAAPLLAELQKANEPFMDPALMAN